MTLKSAARIVSAEVRDVVLGGEAVGKLSSGEIVFVRGGLPGEKIDVRLLGKRRGALHGNLERVTEASQQRLVPRCTVIARCGGCPLMHASQNAQENIKRKWLEVALAGLPTREPFALGFVSSPEIFSYRRRARLRFQNKALGFFEEHSRTLVDIKECVVFDETIAYGLRLFRQSILPHLRGDGTLFLAHGKNDGVTIAMMTETAQLPDLYQRAEKLSREANVAGVALKAGGVTAFAIWGDAQECSQGVDGRPLLGPPVGFSQTNAEVNDVMVKFVEAYAEPEGAHIFELFAGHGNLSIALAGGAASLVAVESDQGAANACKSNLEARGLRNARVIANRAENVNVPKGTNVVVLDPPRTGARDLIERIIEAKVSRVVYVSCHVATLRRDIERLTNAGYALHQATGFDMFPQTGHLEAVVQLRLAEKVRKGR